MMTLISKEKNLQFESVKIGWILFAEINVYFVSN